MWAVAPATVQAATLERFIAGWRKWTPEDFLTTWTDDCELIILPFSFGKPKRTRAQVEGRYRILMENLKNLQLTIHNIVHDTAQGKAAIYAIVEADTDFEPYVNEQAVFITFDKSGEKVCKIEEMNDTAFRKEWDPKYYKHIGWGQPAQPAK